LAAGGRGSALVHQAASRTVMSKTQPLPEPNDVLFRIKRGISGYISYLAACEMNEAFSEYVLYEPILRILTARGYLVQCELPCPGIVQPAKGDKRKIDFVASRGSIRFALEVKWAQDQRLDVEQDYLKLTAFHRVESTSRSFLCVFGRRSHIQTIHLLNGSFREQGEAVYAEFGKTRYGCRIYEITPPDPAPGPTVSAS
jgi:hypothetical protein